VQRCGACVVVRACALAPASEGGRVPTWAAPPSQMTSPTPTVTPRTRGASHDTASATQRLHQPLPRPPPRCLPHFNSAGHRAGTAGDAPRKLLDNAPPSHRLPAPPPACPAAFHPAPLRLVTRTATAVTVCSAPPLPPTQLTTLTVRAWGRAAHCRLFVGAPGCGGDSAVALR